MTPDEARKERQRLETELHSARTADAQLGTRLGEMESRELPALEGKRMDAYQAQARGRNDAQAAIKKAEDDLRRFQTDLRQTRIKREAAAAAWRKCEDELKALIQAEFATFAEDAEQETQKAAQALAELEESYREAYAQWQQAAALWVPLVQAMAPRLRPVEPFPLPEPGRFFASLPTARPEAVVVTTT